VKAKNLVLNDLLSTVFSQCTVKVKEANNAYAVQKTEGQTEVIENSLNPDWS
jgi:hypothetical protein